MVAVTEESPSPGRLLADRLDYLFRTVHPKDRGPYTPAEVAEAINEAAGGRVISSTYIWQLRTGRRDNPTQKHLSALASFFGVSPMYFFQQAEADRDAVPPELIAALRNDEVRDMAGRVGPAQPHGASQHSSMPQKRVNACPVSLDQPLNR